MARGVERDGGKRRRDPQFAAADESDLRLSPDDRPVRRPARDAAHPLRDRSSERRSPARGPRRPRHHARSGRSLLGRLVYWTTVLGVWALLAVGGLVAYHSTKLPPIDQLSVPRRPPNVAILAADGSLLANRGETGGRAVSLTELPPYLPQAFIAIEDHRFRSHWGIDPIGITRAMVRNVTGGGGPTQGGSTLTQQLAKNLFLTQERTVSRKIQEAILALWLERNYSKDQILELYLNRVYFGSGAYGVEAASQRYYGKSARATTLAEAATLAGLVQAPSRLAPNRNPEAARKRAALVVAAMAREGLISPSLARVALTNPASALRATGAGSVNYAADYVMDTLDEVVGAIDSDIVVQTTFDPRLQAAAEKALVDDITARGPRFGVNQGALVAMTPDGAVKALVGGINYADSQFNRASAAKRQPGSAFKPFVYLAALESGMTPETVRDDAPINIKGWRPENYTRETFGPVTLRQALAMSLNTVAVRLGQEVGTKTVMNTAHRLGVDSVLQPNASLALGTSEVTALELTSAYAVFANGGIAASPHAITRVRTADGKTLYQRKTKGFGRVVEQPYVAMMNTMMRDTLLLGTARKAEIPGWEAAGKTGTTQEHRDAWFVGFTSTLVATVWLGNDDNEPMKRVTGGAMPAEVWNRFMRVALQGQSATPLFGVDHRAAPAAIPMARGGAPSGIQDLLDPARDGGSGTAAAGVPGRAPMFEQARAPQPAPRRADGALRPPGSIPGAGPSGGNEERVAPPAERGLLDRLFGG